MLKNPSNPSSIMLHYQQKWWNSSCRKCSFDCHKAPALCLMETWLHALSLDFLHVTEGFIVECRQELCSYLNEQVGSEPHGRETCTNTFCLWQSWLTSHEQIFCLYPQPTRTLWQYLYINLIMDVYQYPMKCIFYMGRELSQQKPQPKLVVYFFMISKSLNAPLDIA